MIACAGAPNGILRQLRVALASVAPPAHAAVARQSGAAGNLSHGIRTQQLPAFPVAFVQDQPADARRRTGRVSAAAPRRDQRQAIHHAGLPIAHRPFRVRHADRPHDALAQHRADVLVLAAANGRGDAVGHHADARVAVLELLARRKEHRCLVARDGERVARRIETLPEITHPAGLLLVLHVLGRRIGKSGRVRTEMADRDPRLAWIVPPLRNEPRRRIVNGDFAVCDGHRQ